MSSHSFDFDHLLISTELPSPGPAYYEARRKLWLTPRPQRVALAPKPNPNRRRKIERLLTPSKAINSFQYWEKIADLWKGVCTGRKFAERMPLRLMVAVVHATWVQDETWPNGAVVQSSDEAPAT